MTAPDHAAPAGHESRFAAHSLVKLESLLVDIEINMLRHLAHHLDSLRRDMPAVLEAIAEPDGDEAAAPDSP